MEFTAKLTPYQIDSIKLVRAKNGMTETLSSVKARTNADIIINGGTYNMNTGKPESFVCIDGEIMGTGYCGYGYGICSNALAWGYRKPLGLADFVGAYGLLIKDGKTEINLNENTGKRERTAIGLTANDELVIYCTSNGIDYAPLAEKLIGMGCQTAINLDGGGSTQWHSPVGNYSSGRAVSWWICIYLTEEGKKAFGDTNGATPDIYQKKTNTGLVEHCKRAFAEGWGYVWGTYGKVLSQDYLDSKAKQYDDVKSQYDWIKSHWLNRHVADCVGLIKSYMWWSAEKDEVGYDSSTDKSAVGMFNAAKIKGTIDTMPDIPGLCVYIQGEHIGVYIGDGVVIEERGTKYGIVKTKLSERGWTHWLVCPYIEYQEIYKDGYFMEVKKFKVGKSDVIVYQDTKKSTVAKNRNSGVGSVVAGTVCDCLGIIEGFAIVVYTITANNAQKVGLIEATKGVVI